MDIYVLDENFNRLEIVDVYTSFIWTDRYCGSGDFELVVSANTRMIDILQKDRYLSIEDSEFTMIIEDVEVTTDNEDGDQLKVTGRTLDSILDRRVIWGLSQPSGSLQDAIERLLNENAINPSDEKRRIPNLIFEKSTDKSITDLMIDAQYFGDNLYDTILKLCQGEYLGFKVTLNSYHKMVFKLYKGLDRTFSQTKRTAVEFSARFDNLMSTDYIRSDKELKNVSFIGGEGEGADRKTSWVYTTAGLDVFKIKAIPSGLKRREMFTDANSVSSKVRDADGHEVALTDAQYLEKLNHEGRQDLSEVEGVTTFSGEVNANIQFIYKRDFYLGDLVQIQDKYGNEGISRIVEVIHSDDSQNGLQMYPTFKSDDDDDWSGTASIDGNIYVIYSIAGTGTTYIDGNIRVDGGCIINELQSLNEMFKTYKDIKKDDGIETPDVKLLHASDQIGWTIPDDDRFNSVEKEYPGLSWVGQSDSVRLVPRKIKGGKLELRAYFGDDDSNGLTIYNAAGQQTAMISATGIGHVTSLKINNKDYPETK